MFSRAYKTVVTAPPLVWVTVFLLVPYLLMFCYSFWSVSPAQAIVHSWNLENYKELLQKTVYWETLLRSMWIAARVMVFSLLLGYPLAYFLSFYAGKRKDLLYQMVIIPLWVFVPVAAWTAVGAFLMQFMVQGAWGVVPAHINELSPDRVRGFLPGFSYQIGVLIAATAPFIEAVMTRHFTYAQSMGTFTIITLLLAIVVIGAGPEAHHVAFGRDTK